MENTRENAELFLHKFGEGKSFVDKLQGIPDFIDLLTLYSNKTQNKYFPNDAYSFDVFAIKDCKESPTGKEAYIGYKINNGNFHFISVPFTEPKKKYWWKFWLK